MVWKNKGIRAKKFLIAQFFDYFVISKKIKINFNFARGAIFLAWKPVLACGTSEG